MQVHNEGVIYLHFYEYMFYFLLTICKKYVKINKVIIEIDSAFQQKNSRKIF